MNSRFNFGRKNGFIMLPRALCNELFGEQMGEMSELMAFAFMLVKVNYLTRDVGGRTVERGCSLLTQDEWCECFGWKKTKTRRFFKMLEREGVIRIEHNHRPALLCILHYEELCANRRPADVKEGEGAGGKPMSKSDALFEDFWRNYHEVTGQVPMEKYATLQAWRKLPYKERILAAECVEQYYMSLPDTRHVRKAINYLKDKSFLLE